MKIIVKMDSVLTAYATRLQEVATKLPQVAKEGLKEGGDLVRTDVRKALQTQTSVKKYGTIVSHTYGGGLKGPLEYAIEAKGNGLPIQEFPFRASRSKRMQVRWSKREHWRIQDHDALGRFGPLDDTNEAGVKATMWGSVHAFQRSFTHPEKGPAAIRGGIKQIRKIFGPSLPKELTKDQSASAFQAGAQTKVLDAVLKRIGRLLS